MHGSRMWLAYNTTRAVLYSFPLSFRSCLSPNNAALEMFTLCSISQKQPNFENLRHLPVEEREQIEYTEHWHYTQVYLPHELILINALLCDGSLELRITIMGSLLKVFDGLAGLYLDWKLVSAMNDFVALAVYVHFSKLISEMIGGE